MEIKIGIGKQKGTDCLEVKTVEIFPHSINSNLTNSIIDGKCFNSQKELEEHVNNIIKNTLTNVTIEYI